MTTKFANRVMVLTATAGTGTVTLGSAVAGYQTFADGGIANGESVRYLILDGNNWEIGIGTYDSTLPTLARTVIEESSEFANAAINLSGSARVSIIASAADLQALGAFISGVTTLTGTSTLSLVDRGKIVVCSNAPWTLSLPAIAAAGPGFAFILFVSAHTDQTGITLDPAGAETINNDTTTRVSRAAIVVCDGTTWRALTLPGLTPQTLSDYGTAALPGMAFSGDPDTGVFRAGANILGLAVNGAERARVTTAGMQITGLVSGTAVTQTAIDTTAGRLLKVGDFGLGADAPVVITNLDDFDLRAGWYTTSSTTTGTFPTHSGSTSASAFGYLLVLRRNLNNTVQIYAPLGNGSGGGRIFYRTATLGPAWLPWRELFSSLNVLGTVSQTAGVPTGALLQGNASTASPTGGWTERDAAGFQIVHHTITSSASGDSTWTYNSAFLSGSTPVISAQPVGDASYFPRIVSRSNTACVFSVRDTSGNRVAVPVDLIARGRWSSMT